APCPLGYVLCWCVAYRRRASFPTRRSSDLAPRIASGVAMPNPWTQASGPPVLGQDGGVVTLLEGNEFIVADRTGDVVPGTPQGLDRKSTRLNSSHVKISYAVFCLKKKTGNL